MQIQKCQAALEPVLPAARVEAHHCGRSPALPPLTTCKGKVIFDNVTFRYTPFGAPALNGFHHAHPAGPLRGAGWRERRGQEHGVFVVAAFLRPDRGQRAHRQDGPPASSRNAPFARRSGWSRRTRSFFTTRSTATSSTDGSTRPRRKSMRRRGRRTRTISSCRCRKGTRRAWATKAAGSRGGQQQRVAIARALAQERADSAARRSDQRAGQRERTHDPARAGNAGQRPHGHRHRAPALDHLEGGPDHRDGRGQIVESGTHAELYGSADATGGCTICSSITKRTCTRRWPPRQRPRPRPAKRWAR